MSEMRQTAGSRSGNGSPGPCPDMQAFASAQPFGDDPKCIYDEASLQDNNTGPIELGRHPAL